MQNKNISAKFGEAPIGTARVEKMKDGSYEIVLDASRNKFALKHELYHIYDNCVEYGKDKYGFFELLGAEFKANLYGNLGIKL